MAVHYFDIKKWFSLEENLQDSLSTEGRLVLGLSFLAIVVMVMLVFAIACSAYDEKEYISSRTTPRQVDGHLSIIGGIQNKIRPLDKADKAQQHAWELNNETLSNEGPYHKWTFV